jgi:cbb3-type cytochrome oxidase subunit 3
VLDLLPIRIGMIDAAAVDLFALLLLGAVIYWFRRWARSAASPPSRSLLAGTDIQEEMAYHLPIGGEKYGPVSQKEQHHGDGDAVQADAGTAP